MSRAGRPAPFSLLMLLLPAMLGAQQRTVSTRTPASSSNAIVSRDEVRAWYAEMQQIGARLQVAHARALRDARLRAARDSLAVAIQSVMDRVDPDLPRLAERTGAMEEEARQARAEGDEAALLELMREANRIQARFLAARERALRQPALVARVRRYEQRLRAALAREEPRLDSLLTRGSELQKRIGRVVELQQMMMEERAASAPEP